VIAASQLQLAKLDLEIAGILSLRTNCQHHQCQQQHGLSYDACISHPKTK
jgi:hypothetical protein